MKMQNRSLVVGNTEWCPYENRQGKNRGGGTAGYITDAFRVPTYGHNYDGHATRDSFILPIL